MVPNVVTVGNLPGHFARHSRPPTAPDPPIQFPPAPTPPYPPLLTSVPASRALLREVLQIFTARISSDRPLKIGWCESRDSSHGISPLVFTHTTSKQMIHSSYLTKFSVCCYSRHVNITRSSILPISGSHSSNATNQPYNLSRSL